MAIVTVTLNPCIDKTCTVERVVPDRKLKATQVKRYPGGGGLNVARVLSRLGSEVTALWTCGGFPGRSLARLLDDEDVPHDPVEVQDDVRENIIVHEAASAHHYRLGMPGLVLSEEERTRWVEKLREAASSARYVVFSGSFPGEAPIEWYSRLLRSAADGARIVVDTKKAALRRALEHGVYLVKPNVRELEEAVGRELGNEDEIERAAREVIASRGAEVMVVSMGRGGALLVTDDGIERFASPSVKLRSRIGAGDSMVGGLIHALAGGRSLAEAAGWGMAAGAAAVMTEGTELCRVEDVEQLRQRIEHREER